MSPFNNARYQALLKRLDIAELPFSRVLEGNSVFRCDSEYFSKDALAVLAAIKRRNPSTLETLTVQITDGVHQALPYVEDGPVRIISAKHPKEISLS